MKSKRATRSPPWPAAANPHRFAHPALTIEFVPVQDLRPSPNNSRDHPKEQIEKLKLAIERFGFLVPVLVDDRNRVIVGHARIEAAKALSLAEIPCIRIRHLSEAQRRAFAILDNRLAEDSAWDFQLLAKEFEFLQAEGIDLQTTGFEIPEFETIFAAADIAPKNTEDDNIPDLVPTRAVTKPNDLWTLGEHRLLCGDARRRESFAALLRGGRVQLVFVDPPFNMKIRGPVSGKGRIKHGEFRRSQWRKDAWAICEISRRFACSAR
jgi:ParB-like nuclease domain